MFLLLSSENVKLNQNIYLVMFIYTDVYTKSHGETRNIYLHSKTPKSPNYIFGNTLLFLNFSEIDISKPDIRKTRICMLGFMLQLIF